MTRILALIALALVACAPTEPLPPASQPGCPGACEQADALACTWAGDGCVAFCDAYHGVAYMRPWADCAGRAGDAHAMAACGIRCTP